MSKEFADFKAAYESLKLVAEGYHVPFDTTQLEKSFNALKRVADKPEEKKEEKPAASAPSFKADDKK